MKKLTEEFMDAGKSRLAGEHQAYIANVIAKIADDWLAFGLDE